MCSGVVRRDEAAHLLSGEGRIFVDVLCSGFGWQEKQGLAQTGASQASKRNSWKLE